jgi:hypothetical protein
MLVAAVSGVVGILCQLTFVRLVTSPSVIESAFVVTTATALTLGSALVGTRRAFVVSALLLAVIWTGMTIVIVVDAEGNIRDSVQQMPTSFSLWSSLAFPYCCAVLLAHNTRYSNIRWNAGLLAVWLAFVVAAAYVGSFALDVGGTPLQRPLLTGLVGITLPFAPYLLSIWLIVRRPDARRI